MFENPRRGRQAINFPTNVPKILDLKSSSEQIFSEKRTLGAPDRILHRMFCAAESAQLFDITRVEKLRFTTRTSGKLIRFDRVVQWKSISLSLAKKMHLSALKRCFSSRKSFVNSSRHLKFWQLT